MNRSNTPTRSVRRLIDANANRALEGARVCEEIIRFHLAFPARLRQLRALRHAIAEEVRRLPVTAAVLVAARDSRNDLGRRGSTSRIDSLERLLLINFQRVKESLRTLEESSRLIASNSARAFLRLRFRTYEVERATVLQLAALRHLRPRSGR
jgi:thiamine-phosphate pyrophosphorylase